MLKPKDYREFIISDGVRGKRLDMFQMFANPKIRDDFKIASFLFESNGGSQITEAHEERVFKFAKLTKAPLRTRLGPVILSAFVKIRHNFPIWQRLYGIDYDRLWEIFKTNTNSTGDHENPGGPDTEEDSTDDD